MPFDDLETANRKVTALEQAVRKLAEVGMSEVGHQIAAEHLLRIIDPTAMTEVEVAAAWCLILYCRRRAMEARSAAVAAKTAAEA